jgi:ectoine hydroxylase
MCLTDEQLKTYHDTGYLFLSELFSRAEVDAMKAELPVVFAENTPRRVLEKGGDIVRSVYGSHTTNEVFRRLSRHPRIVEAALQILESDVYVYQFKINAKAAFGGDTWEWHQDYVFWRKEDSMPEARVVNVVVFLDEVNEFNGPLLLIPGSQEEGMIDIAARQGVPSAYSNSPKWIRSLTCDV